MFFLVNVEDDANLFNGIGAKMDAIQVLECAGKEDFAARTSCYFDLGTSCQMCPTAGAQE